MGALYTKKQSTGSKIPQGLQFCHHAHYKNMHTSYQNKLFDKKKRRPKSH